MARSLVLRWPALNGAPLQYRYLDWAGPGESTKNRYLYVNRGFGFLAFSGSLGIWPEVNRDYFEEEGSLR
jgi:hypothetical protein